MKKAKVGFSKKKPGRPEARWQRQVTDTLSRRPGWIVLDTSHVGLYTAPSGARVKIGIEGQPDLVVIYRGRAAGIELKSEGGRRSKKQEECLDAWGSQGTTIWLLREGDWDRLGAIIAWYEEP